MREVTTYCSLWKLTFRSGEDFFFTDHDEVIQYEGQAYLPQFAAEAALTDLRAGLPIDSGGSERP